MGTTGHYTKYINQYPGWSDNCDSMYRSLPGYGSLIVEHYKGNKKAYCVFDNYHSPSGDRGYNVHIHLIDYEGNKAIQYVLDHVDDIPERQIIDAIFSGLNFYNRAYVDYIGSIDKHERRDIEQLFCSGRCINLPGDDQPFTCTHHPSVMFYGISCSSIQIFQEIYSNRVFGVDPE